MQVIKYTRKCQSFIGGVLMLILANVSCRPKNDGIWMVSGKIAHATNAKIYLQQLSYGATNPIVADSCSIEKDGSFLVKTLTAEQGIYELVIENGPSFLLINDSKEINLQADLHQFKKYTTAGSDASAKMHEFLDGYQRMFQPLSQTLQQLDTLHGAVSDSVQNHLQPVYKQQIQKLNDWIELTLYNTKYPALAYYILAKSFATFEIEETAEMLQVVGKKFPQYSGMQFMQTVVARALPKYPLLNQNYPKFTVTDTANVPFNVDSIMAGKYVLLHFWSATQPSTRAENKNIAALYNQLKSEPFVPIGIVLDTLIKPVKRAIVADNITWPQGVDLQSMQSSILKKYQFSQLPFNVLINPSGKIIAFNLRNFKLEKMVTKAIKSGK